MTYLPYIVAAVGGYLLGSIPFGLILTRAAGLGDIRQIGSGNIGATNVLRTGRKDLAFATLILDSFKAGLAVLFFTFAFASRNVGLIAGAAAFLGHCYPVWFEFKGLAVGADGFLGLAVGFFKGLLVPVLGGLDGRARLRRKNGVKGPQASHDDLLYPVFHGSSFLGWTGNGIN